MPMITSPGELVPGVLAIAREAGAVIAGIYRQPDPVVETKADNSPLTVADRAAHTCIVAGLKRLTPGMPVWSEESAEIPWETRRHWREFWLVDPLDGTKEFIGRNGEFTVNIALVRDHAPVLGVVHAPVTRRDYYGWLGGGAFRADDGGPGQHIRIRSPAPAPVRVTGSRSHRDAAMNDLLRSIGPHSFVAVGSSLKFCLVAEGAADLYPRFGATSAWDTAAGQAVVEAAGGQVRSLAGEVLRYNRAPAVLNPSFVVWGDPERDWLAALQSVADSLPQQP